MMEVNLARSALGFEGQSTHCAATMQHILQHLSGGKLVQIADERVTRGRFLRRRWPLCLQKWKRSGGVGAGDHGIAAIGRDDSDLPAVSPVDSHTFPLFGLNQDCEFRAKENVGGHWSPVRARKRRFAFDDKEIEVLAHDERGRPHAGCCAMLSSTFGMRLMIPSDSILENGIAVEDESNLCFHAGKSRSLVVRAGFLPVSRLRPPFAFWRRLSEMIWRNFTRGAEMHLGIIAVTLPVLRVPRSVVPSP